MVNERIIESQTIAAQVELDVIPLQFAETVAALGRMSATKVARASSVAARLLRALTVRRPDAVYISMSAVGAAFYRDLGYIGLAKAFSVPLLLHLHTGGIANASRTRWRRALYTWAFDGATVIQLSPLLATDIADVADRAHVEYVANGVPDTARPRTIHGGAPRVLFLSNMLREKGPVLLVLALSNVAERGIDFTATFAGAPVDADCMRAFHREVARRGLASRVRYVGPVYGAAKEQLLHDHDVFVLPTLADAFPLVILEAMQWSLPVIASDLGAIPDVVRDEVTGYLTPPGDVDALADRLDEVLRASELRRRLGEAGRARYCEHFTTERFERALADVMSRCAEPSRRLDGSEPPPTLQQG